jgi:hypothetical protein
VLDSRPSLRYPDCETEIMGRPKGSRNRIPAVPRRTMPRIPSMPGIPPEAVIQSQGPNIIFGHNADDHLVLMQLLDPPVQLIFTPDDAEHAGRQLIERAKLARG